MRDTYSLYEAKAKLSEIIRQVRERGRSATITYRGEPVAEIRPLPSVREDLSAHLAALEGRGVLVRARQPRAPLPPPLGERPGALERFLEERE